jgi:hypothetical protein
VGRSHASFGKHSKYLKTAFEVLKWCVCMHVCVCVYNLLHKLYVGYNFL